jgi:uncharacterized membrane protein
MYSTTAVPAQKLTETNVSARINAIDFLRGFVMIIMALDHTRDFFHVATFTGDPLNLATTTPALFLTRWVTHFCAPVFVFLAGCSAYLQSFRKTKKELSLFLLKRGLWLIVVELVLMTFIFSFDIYYQNIVLQVIWAIGISMVILAGMVWLPFPVILAVGLIIVFGHNLLDRFEQAPGFQSAWWYDLLHRPGVRPAGNGRMVMMLYPFLPWTGVLLLGYCLGRLFRQDVPPLRRKKVLAALGIAALVLFVILRAGNVYGDPQQWSQQKNELYSFFSFINLQKYPPSLLFLCVTLGPALIFLALAGPVKNAFARFVTVYGRVPLFYFLLHFFLIHLACMFYFLLRGYSFSEGIVATPGFPFNFVVPGEGVSLGVVYIIWAVLVLLLYPACKWYGNYKRRKKSWWLSYL